MPPSQRTYENRFHCKNSNYYCCFAFVFPILDEIKQIWYALLHIHLIPKVEGKNCRRINSVTKIIKVLFLFDILCSFFLGLFFIRYLKIFKGNLKINKNKCCLLNQ